MEFTVNSSLLRLSEIGRAVHIRTLEKLRTQVIDDRRNLFPLTRKQKDIYRAFDISPPA